MAIFAGISGLISVVIGWVVTIRLLSLARRTRAQPERLLAIAFGGLFCVGYPLAGASRAPGLHMSNEGSLLFALGAMGMVIGTAALARFPLVVFRPSQRWARLLASTLGSAGFVAGFGCAWAVTFAETGQEMIRDIQPWAILLMTTVGVSYAWNGLESTHYYSLMRRRLALGLAEPETTHRFLLWALASWCSVVPIALITAIRATGQPIMSPAPMATIALTSLVTSTCWGFAFFMPAFYRRRVVRSDRSSGVSS